MHALEHILHDDDKLILVEDIILENDGKEILHIAFEHSVHTLEKEKEPHQVKTV